MYKPIFLIVISFILLSSNYEQTKTKLSDLNLQGNVKSLSQISYLATEQSGEILAAEQAQYKGPLFQHDFYCEFNDKGSLDKFTKYHSDGSLYKRHTWEYNENDSLIQASTYDSQEQLILQLKYNKDGLLMEEYSSDRTENVHFKSIFNYNATGDLIEETTYSNDVLHSKRSFTYDGTTLVKEGIYSFETNPMDSVLYKYNYDDKGNPSKKKIYASKQNFDIERYLYKYDTKGNILEKKTCMYDSTLINRMSYQYDEQDNVIEEISYGSDNTLITWYQYQYNDKREVVEKHKYDSEENLLYRYSSKKDKYGNTIEINTFYKNSSNHTQIWRGEYYFDENNNWIKLITFENNVPQFVIKREITYYN